MNEIIKKICANCGYNLSNVNKFGRYIVAKKHTNKNNNPPIHYFCNKVCRNKWIERIQKRGNIND